MDPSVCILELFISILCSGWVRIICKAGVTLGNDPYGSVTQHGTGNGSGTGKQWVTVCYAELLILHQDRKHCWTPLGFISYFPFLFLLPFPVPCIVTESLGLSS